MIYADIHRQRLTLVNEHIVADTIDYLEMKCNFLTDDWDGLEKWAHFANGGTVYDIRLTDDGIRKEDHLNLTAGEWRVYLHGNEFADGMVVERITTDIEVLHVLPAGILDGEPLPEIPASVTEQILARLDKVEKNGGGGGTGGLAPVDKTDAMTAEVGRDENGRLWTAGTGRGVRSFGLGFARGPDGFGEFPALNISREDGQGFSVLLKDIAEQIEPDLSDGLPEYTSADEGKLLRIVNGAAEWTNGISDAEGLIAALSAGGEITLAPDADITVSETLNLPAGTVIHGNGATIRRATGFEETLFNLVSGCKISDFTIEGNRSAMVSPTWNHTMEINVRTFAVGCVIENITLNDANEGIIVSGHDVRVSGCRLYNCGGNGIHFGTAYRCIAEDCVVIGANKNASVMGNSRGCIYVCRAVENVDIVNCYCEDGKAGIGGIDGPDDNHIKISGCTVRNCTRAVEGEYVAEGGPIDVVISGNQFIGCGNLDLTDASQKVAPGDGLVISGNVFTDTGIKLQGFRNANVSGNTMRGGQVWLYRSPHCVIGDNVIDNPGGSGIYLSESSCANVSGNNVRCKNFGVYAENSTGIMIFGNIIRQNPHNVNSECIKLNSCPEAAVDNNKMFLYSGNGITGQNNSRIMGNFIVVADSSQIAIRVWGGYKNYVVAQNMSNGTFAVVTGTNAVVQNNIVIESTAFVDVTYTLTNITTDGFAKALTEDDFGFTLTAADGYSLPDTIAVTMGGTALAAGTGYAYDKATGKVTVYRVSGAVEVTAGGVTT